MPSSELEAGSVKPIVAFGRELVAFRTESGAPAVAQRHCPHLGASLANGRVTREHLACVFHAWEFGTDGRCAKIPYNSRIPRGARLQTYPVQDYLGWLWVFNGPQVTFQLPEFPEADLGWAVRHSSERFQAHAAQILENGCDYIHFPLIHSWRPPWQKEPRVDWQRLNPQFEISEQGNELAISTEAPFPIREKVKMSLRYIGGSTMYGSWSLGGTVIFRWIDSPLPLDARSCIQNLIVWMRPLPWWARPLAPFYHRVVSGQAFAGSRLDHRLIYRDQDLLQKQILVAEDRYVQRFRKHYSSHIAVDMEAEHASLPSTSASSARRSTSDDREALM
jgi:phenylpropionate dioxygenase-like ring-hydroxylating dioxygenase large terminal subunit